MQNIQSHPSLFVIVIQAGRSTSILELNKIHWHFILEKAPWNGGFYEKMVQNVKRNLCKSLKNSQLNFEELTNVLVEVEVVINSRPLTYMSPDDDIEKALTPAHLILGKRLLTLADGKICLNEEDDTPKILSKRAKYLRKLQTHFYRKWQSEYLSELREYHTARNSKARKGMANAEIEKGEIVIIHEEKLPKGQWRLGKVERLYEGNDGVVRGAYLKAVSRTGRTTRLRHPVSKLYPLEVRTTSTSSDVDRRCDSQREQLKVERPP